MKSRFYFALVSSILTLTALPADAGQQQKDIRLVLQLTVDGLRADLLARSAGKFGEGGFQYLLDNGAVFANAHYQHANTETIVGHATLATGAQPSVGPRHPGNRCTAFCTWNDRQCLVRCRNG